MAGSTKSMLGAKSKLSWSIGPTEPYTYTDGVGVVSVNPALSVGEVEDTVLESDFETYLPTIPAGECGFVIRYRPGNAFVKKLIEWALTPTIVHFKVTSPDGSYLTFDAFPKGFTKTFENKTIIDADVPMRIVTKPVFTEAA